MPATLIGAPNTAYGQMATLLEVGVRKLWNESLKLYDDGLLERLWNVSGSEKRTQTDVVMAGLGLAFPKTEGDLAVTDAMQEHYTKACTAVTWGLGLSFTEEAIADNLYIQLVPTSTAALAKSMAYTRAVQAWSKFNDLTANCYAVGGTNYQLLEYSGHPTLEGAAWSNRPQTATALSQAALEERLQAWGIDFRDARGLKVTIGVKTLMVGNSDMMLMHRLLKTRDKRPFSADNDINPVSEFDLEGVVNKHMTDDGRWFLLAPKNETGLTWFDREKMNVKTFPTEATGNISVRATMRFMHMIPHALGIMGSPGA